MAWGMSDNEKDKNGLKPPQKKIISDAWCNFLLETNLLDQLENKPRGWHWFWGLYRLYNYPGALNQPADFNLEAIRDELPTEHWLKDVDDCELDKIITENEAIMFPHMKRLLDVFQNGMGITSTIYFYNLSFDKITDFSNLIFPLDVNFEKITFVYDVSFNNVIFLGNAYFIKANFPEEANFRNAVFHGATAKFSGAVFNKIADFTDTRFKGYANFKSSDFKGRTSFQRAKFEIHAPRFYNAKFNNEMTFSGMKPSKLKKDAIDEYHDFNKKKDKITDANEINKNYRKRIEENQTSYENTSTKLGNQKKYHDEHLFFRNEMYCRQQLENGWLAWVSYFLYQILSDYGYAMGRALGLWLAHMLVWAGILFIWGFKSGCNTYERIACSLITSASNAHSFLLSKSERLENCYAMANNEFTFNLFWAGETILGVLFLFLLLTTLRVHFRFSGITLGNTK